MSKLNELNKFYFDMEMFLFLMIADSTIMKYFIMCELFIKETRPTH